jgi:radical SAM protein with 4Fe4S-binding SPASM domain
VTSTHISTVELPDLGLWDRMRQKRAVFSFDLELTARCNNDCRHCYINLPAGDRAAAAQELSLAEISALADQAIEMGALWCLITGGEPLLRPDFPDVYLLLKRKGLLVSVFTNAALVTQEHVKLFKTYPPRDLEVTVYGVTKETYERVTRRPGTFPAFMRGLNLLLDGGIKVRLKAMAMRSNVHELQAIADFCRARTKDYFRFDPMLHLRFDRNPQRNEEIKSERLTPQEVVELEQNDPQRFQAMQDGCDRLIFAEATDDVCNHLFHCGTGKGNFTIGYDGGFRLCSSLWAPGTVYDLRHGSLAEARNKHVSKVLDMRSDDPEFLSTCRRCGMINLCLWCPAHAYLETGRMDKRVDVFCDIAHARAAMLQAAVQARGAAPAAAG